MLAINTFLMRNFGASDRRLWTFFVGLVVVFALLLGERLFSGLSLRSMAYQLPELGILSLAMMVALLAGGLDLSIIAIANLAALTIAYLLTNFLPVEPGVVWAFFQVVAILAGIAVALLAGAINGAIIAYLGVSPILATLGSMTLITGIGIGFTKGGIISGFPDPIVFIGNGSIASVPVVLILFAVLAILVSIIVSRTPFGQTLSMMGSNEAATRYSGVDTRSITIRVYMLSAFLASIAGIVMMSRFNSANATYGESYLLVTILAAVLGGVSPSGGFGKVGGVVLAVVILQLISTAFNLLGISQFITLVIWGGTLIAVAMVNRLDRILKFLTIKETPCISKTKSSS